MKICYQELALALSLLPFVLWKGHVANFEKEHQLAERDRPAQVHLKWSRIGLESVIFANRRRRFVVFIVNFEQVNVGW